MTTILILIGVGAFIMSFLTWFFEGAYLDDILAAIGLFVYYYAGFSAIVFLIPVIPGIANV